jgi:hypothetical protein
MKIWVCLEKITFHIQVKEIFDFVLADVSRRREHLQEGALDFELVPRSHSKIWNLSN